MGPHCAGRCINLSRREIVGWVGMLVVVGWGGGGGGGGRGGGAGEWSERKGHGEVKKRWEKSLCKENVRDG